MIRTIEISDSIISEGYEPVAYRRVVYGEFYLVQSNGVACWLEFQELGPLALILEPVTSNVSLACRGQVVLVANVEKGPYEQRMLVDISPVDRNYPYICEAIDHRLPHQCWRFAKRVGK